MKIIPLARAARGVHAASCFAILVASVAAQSVTFAPRVDYGTAQENARQALCADFDHDGNLDIAVSQEGYGQGKVEVLFGDGQSDFGSTFEYASYSAWGLADGDFDGDGWDDLVSTAYGWAQHGVTLRLNDTTGGFGGGSTVSTLATPPVAAVAGDFNEDGKLDLAAASEGGGWAVDWFKGNGNGTFGGFQPVLNTHGKVGRRIYAGHFDGDGHLDLLFAHGAGVQVLLNNYLGTLGNFADSGGLVLNENVESAAVVDIDGDGQDDVLSGGSMLRIWHGVGNGTFTLLHAYPTTTGAAETELGDLNNDGELDVVLAGVAGVQIFFGQGGGAFSAPQTVPTGLYPRSCVVGDWNGDGWLDLGVVCGNLAGLSSLVSIYEQVPPTTVTYCVAKTTSVGCSPAIASSGTPSASAGSGFTISASQALNNKNGLLFYGTHGRASAPFQGGTLCVKSPIKRTAVQSSGGNPPPNDCSGSFALDFNAYVASGADPALIGGVLVDAQYWFRDPGFTPPNNTGLSNALEFTLAP
ncbi:MAG: VCBS repeat-containing protein [Planctomycetes bacterium]|nr:VCBS repeat-containing protein [Planctomycetota bacterium]